MKWTSAVSGQFDSSPASYTRFKELFDRFDRDVNETVTTPVPLNGITGLGNPPLSLSKSRKETRHKNSFEGRPKKKARSEGHYKSHRCGEVNLSSFRWRLRVVSF